MQYANFPNEGVRPNPNTGSELVSKNRLALLSCVLERVWEIRNLLDATDAKSQEKLRVWMGSFREYLSQGRRKNLEQCWQITGNQIEDLLEGKLKIDDIFTPTLQKQIANYIGQLFYYPRLKKTHHYTINAVTGDWSVSKKKWCDYPT